MAKQSSKTTSAFVQLRAQGVNLALLETYEVEAGGEVRLFFASGRKVILGGTDPEVFLRAVGHRRDGAGGISAPKGQRLSTQQIADVARSPKKRARDDDPDGVFAR